MALKHVSTFESEKCGKRAAPILFGIAVFIVIREEIELPVTRHGPAEVKGESINVTVGIEAEMLDAFRLGARVAYEFERFGDGE